MEQNGKALYPHHYAGLHFDWPPYRPVEETPEQVERVRIEYAASLSMCDAWLGKVLDLTDQYDRCEVFGQPLPADMQGIPLRDTIAGDTPVRQAVLFGLHGGHVNVTDGRYVYMRAPATPDNQPLYNYTLMPTHMRARFSVEELQDVALAGPFPLYQGLPHAPAPRPALARLPSLPDPAL